MPGRMVGHICLQQKGKKSMGQIDLAQLEGILRQGIASVEPIDYEASQIMQLLYNTGLRINEALEVNRWSVKSAEVLSVQLSKGEGVRDIQLIEVPEGIRSNYINRKAYFFQTQSSMGNRFKKHFPVITFNGNDRRSSFHAFRYRKFKRLAADGMTTAQIAAYMGHVNLSNTARYIGDAINIFV